MSVFKDPADCDDFIKHFITYQKTRSSWDDYRGKIPEDLLEKFREVLTRCKQNGFISPSVENNKLVFKQIRFHNENTDKCTLCNRNIIGGDCIGSVEFTKIGKVFTPCWREK